MAAYKARTIPLTQLRVGRRGFVESLCTNCKSRDCENPIEWREIPVVGIPKRMRVWVSGNRVAMVDACVGFCT